MTYTPYIPGSDTPRPPRAYRRARAKDNKKRDTKARKEIRLVLEDAIMLDLVHDDECDGGDIIMVNRDGAVVGSPLSLDPDGVLESEPSESMMISDSMISGASHRWSTLKGLQVWIKVDVFGRLVVSHSTGTLVYTIHPILWVDGPSPVKDKHYRVALLVARGGPGTRHPAKITRRPSPAL